MQRTAEISFSGKVLPIQEISLCAAGGRIIAEGRVVGEIALMVIFRGVGRAAPVPVISAECSPTLPTRILGPLLVQVETQLLQIQNISTICKNLTNCSTHF